MIAGRFTGRTALITGAGHGIGRSVALRLAREGACVAALDLRHEAAAETAALIASEGGQAAALSADVAEPEQIARAVADAVAAFGGLDVVHNNAGRLVPGTFLDQEPDEWDRTFAVNVRSMMLVTRAAAPHLRRRANASVVNSASISGLIGEAGLLAYGTSKAAVIQLTRQLAAELAPDGIRVNCVCPGWVRTGFNDACFPGGQQQEEETVRRQVPLGRQAHPDEIAAVVAFLASDDASYITGHPLVVDGGLTAVNR